LLPGDDSVVAIQDLIIFVALSTPDVFLLCPRHASKSTGCSHHAMGKGKKHQLNYGESNMTNEEFIKSLGNISLEELLNDLEEVAPFLENTWADSEVTDKWLRLRATIAGILRPDEAKPSILSEIFNDARRRREFEQGN
tara:strand:+ start:285 stop:701 length:417 start_codon:yes stop_codon:yes gene_type:complete